MRELGQGGVLYHFFTSLPVAQEPFLTPRAEALAALSMSAYTRVLGGLVQLAEQIDEQMRPKSSALIESAEST